MHGHDTKIIHICDAIGYPFIIENIITDVKEYSPDVVAFSVGENHFMKICAS